MRLYLHIGCSKTGTSAIQEFLYSQREVLLRKYEILYPQTGIDYTSNAHYYICWSIFAPQFVKNIIKDIPKVEIIYEDLINEINKKNPRTLLISSEFFIDAIPELVRNFMLKITKDIKIILYVRRQDLWLESIYSQMVNTQQLNQEFKDKLIDLKNSEWMDRLNYSNFLSQWQEAFPEAEIIPRIYDRKLFPEGNVILDFLSILGIDMPEAREQKIEANPSLSVVSTLALRKINEKFDLSPQEHGEAVQYLLKLDKEEPTPIKTYFTLPERIEFLEYFRESNERLFREWFNSENKFVLSEEEIKFYEEQDKIPREEIEKMVEDRYRKVITYFSRTRNNTKG